MHVFIGKPKLFHSCVCVDLLTHVQRRLKAQFIIRKDDKERREREIESYSRIFHSFFRLYVVYWCSSSISCVKLCQRISCVQRNASGDKGATCVHACVPFKCRMLSHFAIVLLRKIKTLDGRDHMSIEHSIIGRPMVNESHVRLLLSAARGVSFERDQYQ